MTAAERTNWSRRRAAAISFLTNISLDGSHTDTSFGLFTKKSRAVSGSSGACKVKALKETRAPLENEITVESASDFETTRKCSEFVRTDTVSEIIGCAVGANDLTKTPIMPFRERTNTGGSDYCSDLRSSSLYRKKILHQTSLNDEKVHHHFSSNESIGSVIGRGKGASALLETVGMKEVRFLKTKQFRNHRMKDERLILATTNKIPLAIFSHFPYDRNYKICSDNTVSSEGTDIWKNTDLAKYFSISPFKNWLSPSPVYNFTYHKQKIRRI